MRLQDGSLGMKSLSRIQGQRPWRGRRGGTPASPPGSVQGWNPLQQRDRQRFIAHWFSRPPLSALQSTPPRTHRLSLSHTSAFPGAGSCARERRCSQTHFPTPSRRRMRAPARWVLRDEIPKQDPGTASLAKHRVGPLQAPLANHRGDTPHKIPSRCAPRSQPENAVVVRPGRMLGVVERRVLFPPLGDAPPFGG